MPRGEGPSTVRSLFLALVLSAAAVAAPVGYDYQLTQGADLAVTATLPAGELWLPEGFWPYVSALEEEREGRWTPLTTHVSQGGRLRYHFDLVRAAADHRSYREALQIGPTLVTSPRFFLIQPEQTLAGSDYRMTVTDPSRFESAVPKTGPGVYQDTTASLEWAPAAVLGSFSRAPVGPVDLIYQAGALNLSDAALIAWVQQCVDGLTAYFQRFPVPRAMLVILPHSGRHVFGQALGASVLVLPGSQLGAEELRRDWTLMHELCHLGLPSLPDQDHWLEEGYATWLEPVIRTRVGDLTPTAMWTDFFENLPDSYPTDKDWQSHNYPRIYYGGALFWLLADLRIRLATENRRSLDDGLRAIVAQGGNLTQDWTLDRVVATVDGAVGHPILQQLRTEDVHLNLTEFWQKLGVTAKGLGPGPWAYLRDSVSK